MYIAWRDQVSNSQFIYLISCMEDPKNNDIMAVTIVLLTKLMIVG